MKQGAPAEVKLFTYQGIISGSVNRIVSENYSGLKTEKGHEFKDPYFENFKIITKPVLVLKNRRFLRNDFPAVRMEMKDTVTSTCNLCESIESEAVPVNLSRITDLSATYVVRSRRDLEQQLQLIHSGPILFFIRRF